MNAAESSTVESIRDAEETLSKAQDALDAAQEGLHAAEEVVTKANELKSSPWVKVSIGAVLVLVIAGILAAIRKSKD